MKQNRLLGHWQDVMQRPRSAATPQAGSASGKQQMEQVRESLEAWIGDHPMAALGVALSIGVFVGWLIKRK